MMKQIFVVKTNYQAMQLIFELEDDPKLSFQFADVVPLSINQ